MFRADRPQVIMRCTSWDSARGLFGGLMISLIASKESMFMRRPIYDVSEADVNITVLICL